MSADLYMFRFNLSDVQRKENEEFTLDDFKSEYNSQKITEALADWDKVHAEFRRRQEEMAKAEEARQELIRGKKLGDYVYLEEYEAIKSKIGELEKKYTADYPEEYAAILYDNQPQQLKNILDTYKQVMEIPEEERGRQQENFRFLTSFCEQIQRSSDWRERDGKNVCRLQVRSDKEGKNSIVMMKLENLGGTGLTFTIEDGRSIVFAPDSRLNRRQVAEMSRFFADRGMQIEDFSKLKGLKVYDDRDDQKEIGSFEEIFKQENQEKGYKDKSLAELLDMQQKDPHNQVLNDEVQKRIQNGEDTDNALPVTDENTTQAAVSGENSGGGEGDSYDGKVGFESYLNDEAKPRTYRDMRKAIRARAGIMRINPNCITEKRMPDGSIVISLYGSEADKEADGKMKDGIVQHKKKVGFRMWKNPPRVSIYVPDGGEFKAAYAKGALKAGGQPYFYMPPADEFGGDAQKAFWEAAGDTLTCPILKSKDHPEGCEIGNDHLQVILKAIKDKGADDEVEILKFKMRLVGQLHKYREFKGGKFPSHELKNTCSALEGDIRMHFFQKSVLPALSDHITKGATDKGWTDIDITCAYAAVAKITQAVEKGYITYTDEQGRLVRQPYDYLNPGKNEQAINRMFAEEMGKARPEVIGKIKAEYQKSSGIEIDENGMEDNDSQNASQSTKYQTKFEKAVTFVKQSFYSDVLGKNGVFGGIESNYSGSESCKLTIEMHKTYHAEFGGDKKPFSKLNPMPDLSHITTGSGRNEAGETISIGGEAYYRRGRNSTQAATIQRANATAGRGGM